MLAQVKHLHICKNPRFLVQVPTYVKMCLFEQHMDIVDNGHPGHVIQSHPSRRLSAQHDFIKYILK